MLVSGGILQTFQSEFRNSRAVPTNFSRSIQAIAVWNSRNSPRIKTSGPCGTEKGDITH
jgi:hypothetical protein